MTLKTFIASSTMVPLAWKDRVNTQTDHHQANVLIFASTKAAAVAMLAAAGTSEYDAAAIVSASRAWKRGIYSVQAALVAAGIADPAEPSAFAWRRNVKGQAIARVDVEGLPIVGHFRYVDTGVIGLDRYRLEIEPIAEVQS